MIRLPIYSSESSLADGKYVLEIFPEFAPLAARLKAGDSFSFSGVKVTALEQAFLPDGALEILAKVEQTGGTKATWEKLLAGSLATYGLQLSGKLIRRVSKVIEDPGQVFLIYAGAAAAALGLLWLGKKTWKALAK